MKPFLLIILSSLAFLISCSHKAKPSLIALIQKDPEARISKHEIKNRAEAQKLIQRRFNYLRILFEQSFDPYYGKPKWADTCLSANKIGRVVENNQGIHLLSELILKDQKEGFCPGDTGIQKTNMLMLFCEGHNAVHEFRFVSSSEINLEDYSLCQGL